jgi:hypothetical protein
MIGEREFSYFLAHASRNFDYNDDMALRDVTGRQFSVRIYEFRPQAGEWPAEQVEAAMNTFVRDSVVYVWYNPDVIMHQQDMFRRVLRPAAERAIGRTSESQVTAIERGRKRKAEYQGGREQSKKATLEDLRERYGSLLSSLNNIKISGPMLVDLVASPALEQLARSVSLADLGLDVAVHMARYFDQGMDVYNFAMTSTRAPAGLFKFFVDSNGIWRRLYSRVWERDSLNDEELDAILEMMKPVLRAARREESIVTRGRPRTTEESAQFASQSYDRERTWWSQLYFYRMNLRGIWKNAGRTEDGAPPRLTMASKVIETLQMDGVTYVKLPPLASYVLLYGTGNNYTYFVDLNTGQARGLEKRRVQSAGDFYFVTVDIDDHAFHIYSVERALDFENDEPMVPVRSIYFDNARAALDSFGTNLFPRMVVRGNRFAIAELGGEYNGMIIVRVHTVDLSSGEHDIYWMQYPRRHNQYALNIYKLIMDETGIVLELFAFLDFGDGTADFNVTKSTAQMRDAPSDRSACRLITGQYRTSATIDTRNLFTSLRYGNESINWMYTPDRTAKHFLRDDINAVLQTERITQATRATVVEVSERYMAIVYEHTGRGSDIHVAVLDAGKSPAGDPFKLSTAKITDTQ